MPRITKPKKNNSQAKTKRSQRSPRGNAAATRPPPTSSSAMNTRSRSKAQDEAQKAQALAADREREALCRDWMKARARNLLFEEMRFEELGFRTRRGGRSRKRLREDRRATKIHNLRLREELLDLSATLGPPEPKPKSPPPEPVAETPPSEPEPETSPSTKGASTHAAITAAHLARCAECSQYERTGRSHRWRSRPVGNGGSLMRLMERCISRGD
ncbi:hypothetical protein MMC29_005294 [Sticta canariensis]|nr:hypothetical protein [Sticta canariensis]